jgi:hypothetical protein
MKNSCGSFKHMRAVDGKQNLQFHWPKQNNYIIIYQHANQQRTYDMKFLTQYLC